ncbi:amidohydrolase family protein [Pseudorhodoplanes sp.]|uniref:amidohydrolase family protein n=1 Tax=Pseudorhodoplanes sp. TaxID=1934341 RepID=UPI003D13A731
MSQSARSHLIRGARLLDVVTGSAPHRDLLVVDGLVADIAEPGVISSEFAQVFDATDRMVIPGLVNAHSHAHGALAKGLGDKWTLEHLLNAGRWMNHGLVTEDKYLCGLLNAAELVSRGCTAVYDLYGEFPVPTPEGFEAIGRAYNDVGMRAVVAPMVADRNLFQAIQGLIDSIPEDLRDGLIPVQASPREAVISGCESVFKSWPFDRDWIRPAIAPTIPLHCSIGFIRDCQRLALEFDLGMQTHLAESRAQAVSGIKRYGKTLTAHLEEIGFLGPNLMAAHCVWLDDDDIARLAAHGCSVAHNPGSNLRLGSGLAPVRKMLDRGIHVGIGTDGSNCSDHQNMFESMRLAAFVSRVQGMPSEQWLGASDVASMALAGSAKAMHLSRKGPRLEVGAPADIVFLDLGNLNFVPFNNPLNQLVYSENGSAVDSVMIGGKWVLRHREFQTIDIARLRARVSASVERLREQSHRLQMLADGIGQYISSFCAGSLREPYHIARLCGCADPARPAVFQAEPV